MLSYSPRVAVYFIETCGQGVIEMELRVNIPDDIAAQLQLDGDLGRRTLEALAIEGYRTEGLSLGQVAEMLGLSINQADGFLKDRGIPLLATIATFDHDGEALRHLLGK
jgi:predicted HTH domain antitoxin